MQVCGKEIRIQGRLIRIARLDAEKYEYLGSPEVMLDSLREVTSHRIDVFTFLQKLSEPQPKYAYLMEWDNLAVVPISTFSNWWTHQVDSKTRNMVRKAEKKGVEVREIPLDDSLLHGILAIYNECPVRQGKPFVHYGKDIETVRNEESTFLEHSIFIGAFAEGVLIGFIKLVTDESRSQAGLMNIISLIGHRDKAPTNALIAQAVRSCAERGIPYLVYSNFTYGQKRRDTLSDFKRNNGFLRVDVPRYYVPLTDLGRIAVQLGLHRRLIEYFPEGLLTRLREVRNNWYTRKFRTSFEAS